MLFPLRRDLDFLELFSGWGQASACVRALGYNAQEYDKRRHPWEDVCDMKGLVYAGLGR